MVLPYHASTLSIDDLKEACEVVTLTRREEGLPPYNG